MDLALISLITVITAVLLLAHLIQEKFLMAEMLKYEMHLFDKLAIPKQLYFLMGSAVSNPVSYLNKSNEIRNFVAWLKVTIKLMLHWCFKILSLVLMS